MGELFGKAVYGTYDIHDFCIFSQIIDTQLIIILI